MARRRRKKSVDSLVDQIDIQLSQFGESRKTLSLRKKVQQLCEILEDVKDLGVNVVFEHGWNAKAARERIRLYLVEYPNTVIEGIELAVVSGISDYARRIRELRVELGYQIASGSSPDPESGIILKPDQYLLVSDSPDTDAARRWHIANRIRRKGVGSQRRLLDFLLENVGTIVTTEELAYVAKEAKEFARRIRELRTEEGYAIATKFTGRPDLRMGQYVLQSAVRVAQQHDRNIPDVIQKSVYKRDSNKCRLCSWEVDQWSTTDSRILELHHLEHHQHGGDNIEQNLIVICSKCHDEVHAGKHKKIVEKIKRSL